MKTKAALILDRPGIAYELRDEAGEAIYEGYFLPRPWRVS
jgi:hypothetical protein